jgi:hypothetical protein
MWDGGREAAGRLLRLTSLPFGLFYFDVPLGTPAHPRPRSASLSIKIRLGRESISGHGLSVGIKGRLGIRSGSGSKCPFVHQWPVSHRYRFVGKEMLIDALCEISRVGSVLLAS